jgi:hypothetical protein
MKAMEQLSFGFEDKKVEKNPPTTSENVVEGYEFAENDECQNCGNQFESAGSCSACAGNKTKRKYLENLKKQKSQ